MKNISIEFQNNLFFLTSYLNKKFAYLLINYLQAYSLIHHLFPDSPLLLSQFYSQFIPHHFLEQTSFKVLPTKEDFNLDPLNLSKDGLPILDHFAGNPGKITVYSPPFIEDISLSLGSQWQEKNIGSFGIITLLQLGPNLDLYFQELKINKAEKVKDYLNFLNYPVLLLTKRFQLRQKIEILLKKHPQWQSSLNLQTLNKIKKIGIIIHNLPHIRHQHYLQTRRFYLQFKKDPQKQLPLIHQLSQPLFLFLPYKSTS